MASIYIHDLDPAIVKLGPITLHWYGMAYLMGFVAGFFLLRWLTRRGLWVLPEGKVSDFLTYAAMFGVFLGGRLGYCLFYWLPEKGLGALKEDPFFPFKVWEGGMASHGGILGLILFTWWYSKREKVSWTGLGDGLCVVAPLGLLFGRLANFVNGELYGRPAPEGAWRMKFPTELPALPLEDRRAALDAVAQVQPELAGAQTYDMVIEASRHQPAVREALGDYLTPRYPSQLYEALAEGVLLFAILFGLRLAFPKMRHGVLTGCFFVFYALGRIICEVYREPDSAESVIKIFGGVTKGQFYSYFMILIGLAFWMSSWARGKRELKTEE